MLATTNASETRREDWETMKVNGPLCEKLLVEDKACVIITLFYSRQRERLVALSSRQTANRVLYVVLLQNIQQEPLVALGSQ